MKGYEFITEKFGPIKARLIVESLYKLVEANIYNKPFNQDWVKGFRPTAFITPNTFDGGTYGIIFNVVDCVLINYDLQWVDDGLPIIDNNKLTYMRLTCD